MRLLILFLILLVHSVVFGQNLSNIPIGAWRTHLPTTSATTIALNKSKLYCASEISAFTLDQEDGHMAAFSKNEGLTENEIAVIRFNEQENIGVIGYKSGNIDVILQGKLINFDMILRANIAGSKKINNITLYDHLAFISSDFGVTLIDLKKLEVRESWMNLRAGGLPNQVYGCTLNDARDSVFIATEYGVMSAEYDKQGINLMDFISWKVYTDISQTKVRAVASLNGAMYCGVSGMGVYVLNGTEWKTFGLTLDSDDICWNLISSNNKLIVCAQTKVYVLETPTTYTLLTNTNTYRDVRDAVYDHSGNIWLADANQGLIKYRDGQYQWFSLNGPFNKSTFALYYYNNTILANGGGYTNQILPTYNYSGFYQFENQEKWVSYFRYNSNYPDIGDNIVSKYNPYDDTLYMGHFGFGLISWNKSDKFIIHNTSNSILITDNVTGLDVDNKGTLWIATWVCYACDYYGPSLYSKSKTGQWSSYTLSSSAEANRYFLQIEIDKKDNKWMRYGRSGLDHGLMVYNENGARERYFNTSPAGGGLPSENINCIEIDKNGVVWIGSEKGLAGFYEPSEAFTGTFNKPIYNGFPILFDKNVTCIKTDGGNRKWVGTSEGLWLFNDDFSKALLFFDVNNSPLYSNNIIDLEIHALTGELFIATDKGIISYRTEATEENEDFKAANIFPNPVRPDYAGIIAINGLKDNAVVKITDMQGRLFYETKATGGTATWNMINYAGVKAESGMYPVFVSSEDGTEKYIGKIAIIQ